VRPDAIILRDAVAVVDPSPDRKRDCCAWMKDAMETMRSVPLALPSPAALRDRLADFTSLLRKIRLEAGALGMPGSQTYFAAALDQQIKFAETAMDHVKVPADGGGQTNRVGEVAAALAYQMLKHFGGRATLARRAELASLLSEVVTGVEGADLSRQCSKKEEILARALEGRGFGQPPTD
jgi:hypothetical protein